MESDIGFSFNDTTSSDRILLVEILADAQFQPDFAAEKTKRCRADADARHSFEALGINSCPEEQVLDCQQPDEGEDPTTNDSTRGGEAEGDDNSTWSEVRSMVLRVETLHIRSSILAKKSPFFDKLFSNGMMESEQRHVTLRIAASEEAAFKDLLNFMYSNTLYANTPTALLDVLMAADKFEVASCSRYCSLQLRNLPMSPESALLYLELPSSVLMADVVQPLTDVAKQFLAARYKDISTYREEIMNLPLVGIEVILASDDLEEAVYDLVLNWARTHYPNPEDRRDILRSHLGLHIRFPLLTIRKLKEFHTCDFDPTKSFLDALFL